MSQEKNTSEESRQPQVTAITDEKKTPPSGSDENVQDDSVVSFDTSHSLSENDSLETAQPPGTIQTSKTLQSLETLSPCSNDPVHRNDSTPNQSPPLNNISVGDSKSPNNNQPISQTPLLDLIRSSTQAQCVSCTNANRECKGKKHIKDHDQYQLHCWVYENSDKAQTVAERLEKRRWEQ